MPDPSSYPLHEDLPSILVETVAQGYVTSAAGERLPLDANVSLEEAGRLQRMVRWLKPACSAEIGFAHGISTMAILHAHERNGAGEHHVIDPFQSRFHNIGLTMVERAGLGARLRFYEQFPEEVLPRLPRLQFVLIDSSHLFDLTLVEFVLADKRLDCGGVIAFHDLWMPSLRKAVRYILANRAYRILPESGGNSPRPVSLRGMTARVLQMIPGMKRLLREEVLHPWAGDTSNLLFIEKTAEDSRDWRFHAPF